MITSMTGFGAAERITDQYSLKVEIKTLNSKFFDPSFKLPKEFVQWEMDIKSLLEKGLIRGKVSLAIDFQTKSFTEAPVHINDELFSVYHSRLKQLAEKAGEAGEDIFKIALGMPNVITPIDDISSILSLEDLKATISEAVANCAAFRKDEGGRLAGALNTAKEAIAKGLKEVEELDPERVENVKGRIQQSLSELKERVQVDQNRFEQELIYYIEKFDLTEEKVRLKSHLDYFDEVVNQPEASGKKLGFLGQEIGREINTIGSKANHAGIQRAVVGMKEELEKIKEQVLNVL